jgi:hypothetical protein
VNRVAVGFVSEETGMRTIFSRSLGFILLALVLFFTAPATVRGGQGKLVAVDSNHIAIQGYDTVAYFTDGKAVKGSSQFEYVFDDAKWWFSSAAHRSMFVADPDHYMPQYGGFCAACVATNACFVPADPKAWTIVDGKLYMVAGKTVINGWKANSAKNIQQADAHWPAIQQRQAAQQQ